MHSVDEIRLEQGNFVFVRKGGIEPLITQWLPVRLLANMEDLILGRITPVAYEQNYLDCLAIEQGARINDQAQKAEDSSGAIHGSLSAGSGRAKAEAKDRTL